MDNLYAVKPSVALQYIIDCFEANLVPYLQSSPGMGKSSMIKSIAEQANLELIDISMAGILAEDFTGLPFAVDGEAKYLPFSELFPLENTPIPEGKNGFLLFFDEFNATDDRRTMAATYKTLINKVIGDKKLHPNTYIALAGNLSTDNAITNPVGTAIQSRVVHINMTSDYDDYMNMVAVPFNFDKRIIGYLSYSKNDLNNFDPNTEENTFCCERTWHFLDKQIKASGFNPNKLPLYAGTISAVVASKFVQFAKLMDETIVNINDIVAAPDSASVPNEHDKKWIIMSHLMEQTTLDNYPFVSIYVKRFPLEFKILFLRHVSKNIPSIRTCTDYQNDAANLSTYLN